MFLQLNGQRVRLDGAESWPCMDCGEKIIAPTPGEAIKCPACGALWSVAKPSKNWLEPDEER